jgi:AsmA-like C-terminal region
LVDEEIKTKPRRGKRVFKWIMFGILLAVVTLGAVGWVMVRRAGPILKGRVIETLSARFDSKVEMDNFQVGLGRGLEVSGDGLRIFPPADVVAAGADKPLIVVEHFAFYSGLRGLFQRPMHVGTVHVRGLAVNIPPREERQAGAAERKPLRGKIKIFVDEIVCDDSRLVIGTLKPGKEPKDFELRHIEMHNVGPELPWQYDATIVNAIPKGDIHATGTFGPWDTESPGDSAVTGHYTFDHADLNPIKGIGGILSSVGDFTGQLDRIAVHGTTETPDFSLDTTNKPVPLHTEFEAVVDGTTGDTYLQNVKARLGASSMTASGQVVNVKGKGHIVDIDVDVPNGRIQDFLDLAVKTRPVVMTGTIRMRMKLHVPYGKESVAKKMSVKADFGMQQIHMTNPQWQDKIDDLSLRAQGDPKAAKPGAEDVTSQMKGKFTMEGGKLDFSSLTYNLPGAEVQLTGVYSLDGDQFNFHGNVQTDAKLSQMVATKWKSFLLKAVDPFFTKDGKGAQIPIAIQGTKDAPKFGLDLKHKGEDRSGASEAAPVPKPVPPAKPAAH